MDNLDRVMRPFGRKSWDFIMREPAKDHKYTILVGSVRSAKTFTVDAKTIVQYSRYDVPGKRFIGGLSKDASLDSDLDISTWTVGSVDAHIH